MKIYVSLTWENWPNCGSYGGVYEVSDDMKWTDQYNEAVELAKIDMAEISEGTVYWDQWHVVDILHLDDQGRALLDV